jgi:hypothetical protein
MADIGLDYRLRVHQAPDGTYTASLRQFSRTMHPEVMAVTGPVARGTGEDDKAAMVAAVTAYNAKQAKP